MPGIPSMSYYTFIARLWGGLYESTKTLYRDREIHLIVKDLQSTTRLAEWWTLQIFDERVDFAVPAQSRG